MGRLASVIKQIIGVSLSPFVQSRDDRRTMLIVSRVVFPRREVFLILSLPSTKFEKKALRLDDLKSHNVKAKNECLLLSCMRPLGAAL